VQDRGATFAPDDDGGAVGGKDACHRSRLPYHQDVGLAHNAGLAVGDLLDIDPVHLAAQSKLGDIEAHGPSRAHTILLHHIGVVSTAGGEVQRVVGGLGDSSGAVGEGDEKSSSAGTLVREDAHARFDATREPGLKIHAVHDKGPPMIEWSSDDV
jgi:hypothetical protein